MYKHKTEKDYAEEFGIQEIFIPGMEAFIDEGTIDEIIKNTKPARIPKLEAYQICSHGLIIENKSY